MGTAGWIIPGAGHMLQGKWLRGIILGAAVWICFVAGLSMGGHLFSVSGGDTSLSTLLQVPPTIANLGSGILYLVCWFLGFGRRGLLSARLNSAHHAVVKETPWHKISEIQREEQVGTCWALG